ncbi:hypothetical protein HBB16_11795 [Pseudonocardia sp. MCCB 268]|nr:hypothetical protein [Pseudonocardia cytotoxica]
MAESHARAGLPLPAARGPRRAGRRLRGRPYAPPMPASVSDPRRRGRARRPDRRREVPGRRLQASGAERSRRTAR